MAAKSEFRGVYPMLYAFFDARGRLDRGAMRAQVEYCVASGAHGIAALGLGTEVSKLEPEERRQVVEWVGRGSGAAACRSRSPCSAPRPRSRSPSSAPPPSAAPTG